MASVGDRVWKVTVTGYVIQKEYMDEPDTWDTLDPLQWDDFLDVPNIEYTELVEPKPLETTKEDWDLDSIIDKIYGEHNLKSPKDIRIEELEAQLRELQDWDSADLPNGERIYNKGQ